MVNTNIMPYVQNLAFRPPVKASIKKAVLQEHEGAMDGWNCLLR